MTGPSNVPVGYLTDEQRRRVQALAAAVAYLPTAATAVQIQVSRWIVTGRWDT